MDLNEFEQKLREAYEVGARMQISGNQNSRPHSLAMTHLETAQLWAQRDSQEKARTGEVPRDEM